MTQIKQDYYANPQGVQLYDFFDKVITPKLGFHWSLTQGFYLLNAIKYTVRAGRKPDNDKAKDLNKADDYVQLLAKHDTERNPNTKLDEYYLIPEYRDVVESYARDFERFNGEEI